MMLFSAGSAERCSTEALRPSRRPSSFAASIAGFLSFESTTALTAPPASFAMFNKDLDVPIEDPIQAIAVIYAVRACIGDVLAQMELFATTCPAPTFPCDLSQLNTKASTRISGPLARALPACSRLKTSSAQSGSSASSTRLRVPSGVGSAGVEVVEARAPNKAPLGIARTATFVSSAALR